MTVCGEGRLSDILMIRVHYCIPPVEHDCVLEAG